MKPLPHVLNAGSRLALVSYGIGLSDVSQAWGHKAVDSFPEADAYDFQGYLAIVNPFCVFGRMRGWVSVLSF